jgi:hypothetical protein
MPASTTASRPAAGRVRKSLDPRPARDLPLDRLRDPLSGEGSFGPAPSGVHVLVAPDKFKGSLDAVQVAARVTAGLRSVVPELPVVQMPVADGGDGTVDAAVAAGFERVPVSATGPTW